MVEDRSRLSRGKSFKELTVLSVRGIKVKASFFSDVSVPSENRVNISVHTHAGSPPFLHTVSEVRLCAAFPHGNKGIVSYQPGG
jgi:hypothetical protein